MLFTVIKGAEEDADQFLLTDKLLQAVLAEAQIVCVGQPLLIAGDLNADPAVIPCLAKGISAGEFVDLALAYSLGEERRPDATCKFTLEDCVLPLPARSQIGGLLFIFQYLPASVLIGRLRFLAPLFPSLCGLLTRLTLLIFLFGVSCCSGCLGCVLG